MSGWNYTWLQDLAYVINKMCRIPPTLSTSNARCSLRLKFVQKLFKWAPNIHPGTKNEVWTPLQETQEAKLRSERSSPLQILLDLLGVLAVEALALLVELLVSLVDVGNVCIINVCPPAAELGAFRYLSLNVRSHLVQSRCANLTWRGRRVRVSLLRHSEQQHIQLSVCSQRLQTCCYDVSCSRVERLTQLLSLCFVYILVHSDLSCRDTELQWGIRDTSSDGSDNYSWIVAYLWSSHTV